jgi:hypothetical protein
VPALPAVPAVPAVPPVPPVVIGGGAVLTQTPFWHSSSAPQVTPVHALTHAPFSQRCEPLHAMQGLMHTPAVHTSPALAQGIVVQSAAFTQWPWLSSPGSQFWLGRQCTPVHESVQLPDTHF